MTLLSHRAALPLLTALVAIPSLACGGSAVAGADGGGGSGGAAGGGGAGTDCSGLADESPTQAVAVVVRNERADNLYLSGSDCGMEIDLSLFDDEGEQRAWRWNGCNFTCEALQQQEGICSGDCAAPPVVMVAPGGSHTLTWTGVLYEPKVMADACYFGEPRTSCPQQQVAAPGSYELGARGWSDAQCPEPGCVCEPDADGSCELAPGAWTIGTLTTKTVPVAYPGDTVVEIVFD